MAGTSTCAVDAATGSASEHGIRNGAWGDVPAETLAKRTGDSEGILKCFHVRHVPVELLIEYSGIVKDSTQRGDARGVPSADILVEGEGVTKGVPQRRDARRVP